MCIGDVSICTFLCKRDISLKFMDGEEEMQDIKGIILDVDENGIIEILDYFCK